MEPRGIIIEYCIMYNLVVLLLSSINQFFIFQSKNKALCLYKKDLLVISYSLYVTYINNVILGKMITSLNPKLIPHQEFGCS